MTLLGWYEIMCRTYYTAEATLLPDIVTWSPNAIPLFSSTLNKMSQFDTATYQCSAVNSSELA